MLTIIKEIEIRSMERGICLIAALKQLCFSVWCPWPGILRCMQASLTIWAWMFTILVSANC